MASAVRHALRVALAGPARQGAVAASRLVVRGLRPEDATLAAVVRALRAPSDQEQPWAARIEAIRAQLAASNDVLRYEAEDRALAARAIAMSTDPQPPVLHEDHLSRTLGEVTRVTSAPPAWGRFLYRLVRELRPGRCLELGTSVGISGCYLGAGLSANGMGRLITIEGTAAAADVARDVFAELGLDERIEVRTGLFAERLPGAIADLGGIDMAFIDGHHQYEPTLRYFAAVLEASAPGALLVFDDVSYRLGNMKDAWQRIRSNARVTGSMTIHTVGIAVVDGRSESHRRLPRLPL
jgi:predicted O-methyltransferase YrrM